MNRSTESPTHSDTFASPTWCHKQIINPGGDFIEECIWIKNQSKIIPSPQVDLLPSNMRSLKLTAKAPENRPSQKLEISIPNSNHPFSGAMLVSGRVSISEMSISPIHITPPHLSVDGVQDSLPWRWWNPGEISKHSKVVSTHLWNTPRATFTNRL